MKRSRTYEGHVPLEESTRLGWGSFRSRQQSFADADGVSDYSYEYWKGYKAGTVKFDLAVNETLAEMRAIKKTTGKFPEHYGERRLAYRGKRFEDRRFSAQAIAGAD